MKYRLLPFYLFFLLLTYWVKDNAFFWDTIQLGSKHAHFFFENGFSNWILPESMDSGHPPIFGAYLALCWKILGKSLVVSHFAMLPFLLGIVYQLDRLIPYYFEKSQQFWVLGLLLSTPVFLGQASLVSPDIVLIFFFLLAWNQIIWQGNIAWKILAFICLGLISTRGMMLVLGVYFFEISSIRFELKKIFLLLLQYFPAGIISLTFLLFHFYKTDWIGYHPNSPWAPAFERVDVNGFIKNGAVLVWRCLDFGMIGAWVILVFFAVRQFISRKEIEWRNKGLVRLMICLSLTLLPSFMLYKGLSQHRYLLPLLVIAVLWILYWLSQNINLKTFRFAAIFMLLTFWTGHLWVYPDKISQGWDSTLGHLPFYEARKDLLRYIEAEQIPIEKIGAAAFINDSSKYMDLEASDRGFRRMDFQRDSFIVYSNISNDYSDEQLLDLKQDWELIKDCSKGGVKMILYKAK